MPGQRQLQHGPDCVCLPSRPPRRAGLRLDCRLAGPVPRYVVWPVLVCRAHPFYPDTRVALDCAALVACPANSTYVASGAASTCRCQTGFRGTITWTGSAWKGQCVR
jgi:hypothetical protein